MLQLVGTAWLAGWLIVHGRRISHELRSVTAYAKPARARTDVSVAGTADHGKQNLEQRVDRLERGLRTTQESLSGLRKELESVQSDLKDHVEDLKIDIKAATYQAVRDLLARELESVKPALVSAALILLGLVAQLVGSLYRLPQL